MINSDTMLKNINSLSIDTNSIFVPFDYGYPLNITERNLPHWEQQETTYFVTFRLADSIPTEKIKKYITEREIWLKNHEKPLSDKDWLEYNRLFSEKIQNLLDSGSGSCILADKIISDIVKNALLHFDDNRYKLGKWVIMPNHVHLLVTPLKENLLHQITHSWKSFTANKINSKLNKTGNLWQEESYDHIVRNKRQLKFIEEYIINNPEKAKLKKGFQASSDLM